MAMTETFAATAAQTIPVFALAGVFELRALRIVDTAALKLAEPPTQKGIATLAVRFIVGFLWLFIITIDFKAEAFCLTYLRHRHIGQSADIFIQRAMLGSLAALVFTPAFVWIVSPILVRHELEFKAARARKRAQQTNSEASDSTSERSQSAEK